VKAISFIPIVARVAIELGVLFDGEEERGGLLCYDNENDNVLQNLMNSDSPIQLGNREYHKPIDDKYLQVLIQLRKMNLFKKDDIQMNALVTELCNRYYHFSEKRFRFLVEWDPSALIQTNDCGYLPLHYVTLNSSIREFKLVFEYGIRYFPEKKGINLLFQKRKHDYDKETPFQCACKKFGYKKVLEVVEDTLVRSSSSFPDNNTPTSNIMEALITAAIDENVHLDGVYFLLRREPDVLVKLLSQTSLMVMVAASVSNNNNNSSSNGRNDGTSNMSLAKHKLNSTTTTAEKKRKRER
jgi:hypothetical protein